MALTMISTTAASTAHTNAGTTHRTTFLMEALLVAASAKSSQRLSLHAGQPVGPLDHASDLAAGFGAELGEEAPTLAYQRS